MENRRINSKKRQAVYDILRSVTDHPTAEMLYNRLKPEYPELSLGTVYRNLLVLEQEGLVIRVGNVEGQERYDARLIPHAHFICSRCHGVSDIELSELFDRLLPEIDRSIDGQAQSLTLTVKGVCGECGRL